METIYLACYSTGDYDSYSEEIVFGSKDQQLVQNWVDKFLRLHDKGYKISQSPKIDKPNPKRRETLYTLFLFSQHYQMSEKSPHMRSVIIR
jgi:hypothetical protein